MPIDIAGWGEPVLLPDNPFRRIEDTLYAEIHTLFDEDLADIPSPAGLGPIDLAIILALQDLERLTAGGAAYRLRMHMGWKYAPRLPMDHRGCTGRDLKTFLKRVMVRYQKPFLEIATFKLITSTRMLLSKVSFLRMKPLQLGYEETLLLNLTHPFTNSILEWKSFGTSFVKEARVTSKPL